MKTIVVCIDFSEVSDRVLEVAIPMASVWQASLCLLHIAPPDPSFVGYDAGPQTVRDQVAAALREEHQKLHAMKERVEARGVTATARVFQGPTVEKILEELDTSRADMVIMGSHGHSALRHLLVGSVSEGVLRKATCPMLVVPMPSAMGQS